jgi:Na+/proline symporter
MFPLGLLVIIHYVNDIITVLYYIIKLDDRHYDYCVKSRNVGTAVWMAVGKNLFYSCAVFMSSLRADMSLCNVVLICHCVMSC